MRGLAFWKHHYFTDLKDSKVIKIFTSEYAVKARLCGILKEKNYEATADSFQAFKLMNTDKMLQWKNMKTVPAG